MKTDKMVFVGVGAIIFRNDDVLVIKRGKAPFKGLWSIPGGGLEHGEALLDAVRREVREETNVEINILGLLDVFESMPREQNGEFLKHMLLVDYVAEWVSGAPRAGDDAAEAEFVSFETAMTRLSWDLTRQALIRAAKFRTDFHATS